MVVTESGITGIEVTKLPDKTEYIESVADEWHKYARKYRKWAYMFESAAALADALALKYDLGIRTRAAYLAGDKDELRELAKKDYVKVYKLIEKFALAFEKQWNIECKVFGFEVLDIRLGGLARRLQTAKERIEGNLAGGLTALPELEEPRLPNNGNKNKTVFASKWSEIVTATTL